ncbi:MAG: SDR family oxidoreductase [Solirubrobacterales bacterium]|nr:SDR family oxidoreductase [Solirubrobacterales bacterium]
MAKRAALVTGGSGGIGLAIARRLAESGYAVTISGRREEKLLKAAEGLADDDLKVEAVVADVTSEEAVVELVAEHQRQWGRLDCLVNNAGIGIGAPIDQIQTKHFDLQVAVNLRALVVATRESMGMLKRAGEEHGKALVVNLASLAGVDSPPWLSVYGATKAAVIGFSRSTQKELVGSGVAVTAICPGFVATDMTEFAQETVPAEEMMQPEDLAEAVSFLLKVSPACAVPELVMARPVAGPDTQGM